MGEWGSWIDKLVPLKCPRLIANDRPNKGGIGLGLSEAKWAPVVKQITRVSRKKTLKQVWTEEKSYTL